MHTRIYPGREFIRPDEEWWVKSGSGDLLLRGFPTRKFSKLRESDFAAAMEETVESSGGYFRDRVE